METGQPYSGTPEFKKGYEHGKALLETGRYNEFFEFIGKNFMFASGLDNPTYDKTLEQFAFDDHLKEKQDLLALISNQAVAAGIIKSEDARVVEVSSQISSTPAYLTERLSQYKQTVLLLELAPELEKLNKKAFERLRRLRKLIEDRSHFLGVLEQGYRALEILKDN